MVNKPKTLSEREMKIIEGVKMLGTLFQIDVGDNPQIERCVIVGDTLHSFGFFDKVHSEIEAEGIQGQRGYILSTEEGKVFFTYQDTIQKSDIPKSVKDGKKEIFFSRVITLQDIISHPQKESIFALLKQISSIEKEARKDQGIGYTDTDGKVHKVLEVVE